MEDRKYYHRNEKIHFQSTSFGETSHGSDLLKGSVVLGDYEKKHFPPRYSQPDEFKPGCKMIDHLDRCPDDVKIPKRRAQLHTLTFTASNRYRDRRHLNESDLPCVQNPEVKDMHWTRKKVVIDDDKKIPISLFRSSEYNLEKVITSKQRIVSSEQKRNYIPVASEGDKPFKVAELSPNFFQSGGLIPGSTIQPRPVKQLKGSKASNETLTKSIKSMTATEKRLQYINESDKTQVEMLNNTHFKRGQELPSWEEKTGMWLCRPDEEDD